MPFMHRTLIAVCALLAAAVLPARGQVEPAPIVTRMRSLIIPQVKANSTPVSAILDDLQAQSRAADPAGLGVNIVYLPPSADTPEGQTLPRATMEFREIPVGEAIRYTCVGATALLDYVVEEHAVVVYHRMDNPLPRYTRTYALPYWISGHLGKNQGPFGCLSRDDGAKTDAVDAADAADAADADKDAAEDADPDAEASPLEAINAELKASLESFGVVFGHDTALRYLPEDRKLLVTNTAPELRRIDTILATVLEPITLCQIDLVLLRVMDAELLADPSAHALSLKRLAALPAAKRQVLYRASPIALPGQATTLSDTQRVDDAGGTGRAYRATVTSTLDQDNRTFHVELNWTMQAIAADPDAPAAAGAMVKTRFIGTAAAPMVFAVQSEQDRGAQLYLVVTPQLITPNGDPAVVAETDEED